MTINEVNAIIAAAPAGELELPAYTGGPADLNYLKSYVLSAVTARYGVAASTFDSATLLSTSILRDFVHRAIYDHPSLISYDVIHAANKHAYQSDYGAFFREEAWALCGQIAWQLHNIYQAFGYDSAVFWVFDTEDGAGTPDSYGDGHVRAEVMLTDLDKFVCHDPTFNFLMTDQNETPLSFREAQLLNKTSPSDLHFVDTGIITYRGTLGFDGLLPHMMPQYRANYMNVVYAWMEGGVYSQEQRQTHLDWATAHTAVFIGAYATATAAKDAVMALKAAGKSLLSITDALRGAHDVSGFRVLSTDGETLIGDFVTLQLSDGNYVTINIDAGAILNGSYDQIIDDLTGAARGLNPGVDLIALLGPGAFIRFDGQVIVSWDAGRANPLMAGLLAEELTRSPVVYLPNGQTQKIVYDSAGDQTWARMTRYLNYSGVSTFDAIYHDDGGRSYVSHDVANSKPWVRLEHRWDASGQFASITYFNDDGSRKHTAFDFRSVEPWSEREYIYNAAGALVSDIAKLDAGGTVSTVYDHQGVQIWASWASHHTAAGQLADAHIAYDNGGWLDMFYDYQAAQPWSSRQERYTASGLMDAERYDHEGGGYLRINYDVVGSQSWLSQHLQYDAQSRLLSERLNYDAGGDQRTFYDVAAVEVWSTKVQTFSPSGAMTNQLFNYDAGGRLVCEYDAPDLFDWSQTQRRYSAANMIEAEIIFYDDGGKVRTDYTDADSYTVDTFGPGGALISHLVYDDGVLV